MKTCEECSSIIVIATSVVIIHMCTNSYMCLSNCWLVIDVDLLFTVISHETINNSNYALCMYSGLCVVITVIRRNKKFLSVVVVPSLYSSNLGQDSRNCNKV